MGKVYSSELRAQDDELKRFGVVSEKTRRKANSAWTPDFSSYDFLPQFLRWEGVTFKEVQKAYGIWRKMGCEVSVSKNAYECLMRASGLATRNPSLNKREEDEAPHVLSTEEENKLEILHQFTAFSESQKNMSSIPAPGFGSKAKTNPGERISMLDVFAGLALISKGTSEQKSGFVFALFDFKRRKSLSRDECIALLHASVRGFCIIKGVPVAAPEGLTWLCDERLMKSILENEKSKVKKELPLFLKTLKQQDGDEMRCSLSNFVDWCKHDSCAEVLISSGSSIGNGTHSAFVERKRAEQKKLLVRLARVETSLEMLGEAKFEPTELLALLDAKTLAPPKPKQQINNSSKKKGEGKVNQGEQEDEGETPEIDGEEMHRIQQRTRRKVAGLLDILIHGKFPILAQYQTKEKRVKDPEYMGLTIQEYTDFSLEDREEWLSSNGMFDVIQAYLERIIGVKRVPNVTVKWLVDMARRCGVAQFDEVRLQEKEEDIAVGALIQWIRHWSMPAHLHSNQSIGRYWAWTRVLVPMTLVASRLTLPEISSNLLRLADTISTNSWIGEGCDRITQTKGKVSIGLQNDEDWIFTGTVTYQLYSQPIPRSVETNDYPRFLHHKTDEELEALEEKDDSSTNSETEQLEYEISRVESCDLLNRGKDMYMKAFHQIAGTYRGSILKSGLKNDGVGVYILVDFASSITAQGDDINRAAFKVKVLFTHEYWEDMLAGIVKGVHITEFSEYVGSAKKVRLVLFLEEQYSELIKAQMTKWFGETEVCSLMAKMGSSVSKVMKAAWDGDIESLWSFRSSDDEALTEALYKNEQKPEEVEVARPARRGALNSKWKGNLGLGKRLYFEQERPKETKKSTATANELSPKELERISARHARMAVTEKRTTLFAESCIQLIVDKFDKDKDGGLNWLEVNELQKVLAPSEDRWVLFESEEEFVTTMSDDGIDIRPMMILTPSLLTQVYINAPPELLVHDLGKIGIAYSSLADSAFQFEMDVKGPVSNAKCDIGRTHKNNTCPKVKCNPLDHLLAAFKTGKSVMHVLWENHAIEASLNLEFSNWRSLFNKLEKFIKRLLPAEHFQQLQRLIFETAFARNFAHNIQGLCHSIVECLFAANIGCLDDEIDDEEEKEQIFTEEELLKRGQELEAKEAEEENEKEEEDVPLSPDFQQRALLKMVHHLLKKTHSVVSGVSHVHVRISSDRSITAEFEGFDIFDWLIPEDDDDVMT